MRPTVTAAATALQEAAGWTFSKSAGHQHNVKLEYAQQKALTVVLSRETHTLVLLSSTSARKIELPKTMLSIQPPSEVPVNYPTRKTSYLDSVINRLLSIYFPPPILIKAKIKTSLFF